MTERIVISGTGGVCGLGRDADAMLDAIVAGRSAIGPIAGWDTAGWPVTHAAEIADFNARSLVDELAPSPLNLPWMARKAIERKRRAKPAAFWKDLARQWPARRPCASTCTCRSRAAPTRC